MASEKSKPVIAPSEATCGWISQRSGGTGQFLGKFPTAAAAQAALVARWEMLWRRRRH